MIETTIMDGTGIGTGTDTGIIHTTNPIVISSIGLLVTLIPIVAGFLRIVIQAIVLLVGEGPFRRPC
jgi:hypothetical protein